MTVMLVRIWCLFAACLLSYFSFAQNIENIGKQKPVSFGGSLDVRGIFYNASGIPPRSKSFNYFISGSPTLSVYGLNIPFYFTLGSNEKSFRQPFNQFGLSPNYKWVTVHAGYRNLNFSPFTLAGHTMLGGGIELNPKNFRLAFMYGRLNRATEIDTSSLMLVPVSFERKGWAAKIGFGKPDRFVDLIMLHASDDVASVKTDIKAYNASVENTPVYAAENLVAGISSKIKFLKYMLLETDLSYSIYTGDKTAAFDLDSSTGIVKAQKIAGDLITLNSTTQHFGALQTALRYNQKKFGLRLSYSRIAPGYKSMGAYFINNDLENITFGPTFSAFNNKLRFSGSIGLQHDNLKDQKMATSKKVIGMANLSAEFNRYAGLDLSYSNFSNNQTPNTTRFADTLRITQTTNNLSITPRVSVVGTNVSHIVVLSASYMKLNDFNNRYSFDTLSRKLTSKNYFLTYTVILNPKDLSVFATLNDTKMNSSFIADENRGITAGFDKALLKKKLMVRLSNGWLQGIRNDEKSLITTLRSQISYSILKRQRLSFMMNYMNNKPDKKTAVQPHFKEFRGELGYTVTL